MKKSYDQNRALLKRKGAFHRMKDHYQQRHNDQPRAAPDFEELERWRDQRARTKRRERAYVLLIYLLLAIGTVTLYQLF